MIVVLMCASGASAGIFPMKQKRIFLGLELIGLLWIAMPTLATAATLTTIFNFGGATGSYPIGNIVADSSGALYGTTEELSGTTAGGVVFKLTPNGDGTYTEAVLHEFGGLPDDGSLPSRLIIDASGALYGTTIDGGDGPCNAPYGGRPIGCGTVYKVTPNGDGTYAENILHNFEGTDPRDGYSPDGLVMDLGGALYGTTFSRGLVFSPPTSNPGTAFKLTPQAGGSYGEQIIKGGFGITQGINAPRTYAPGNLLIGEKGVLYGTTVYGGGGPCGGLNGGTGGCGTVFKLRPRADGTYARTTLHSFAGYPGDGAYPVDLVMGAGGVLFGVTQYGGSNTQGCGSYGCGTVFALIPNGTGGYTESILHDFGSTNLDGVVPAAIVLSANGALFGVTRSGGSQETKCGGPPYGCGTIFKITADGTELVLHRFTRSDGESPTALLSLAPGVLFGTTYLGGASSSCKGCGTVFELRTK